MRTKDCNKSRGVSSLLPTFPGNLIIKVYLYIVRLPPELNQLQVAKEQHSTI